MNKQVFVYALCEPGDLAAVRYIGCTTNFGNRMGQHLRAGVQYGKTSNTAVSKWINLLFMRQAIPSVKVLEVAESTLAAKVIERRWISQLKASHDLLNILDGGPQLGHLKRAVLSVRDNLRFSSLREAANHYGLNEQYLFTQMKKDRPAKGHYLCYEKRPLKISEFKTTCRDKRPVRCLNNGMVFPCASDAASFFGISKSGVRSSIYEKCKCMGVYFCYDGDYATVKEFLGGKKFRLVPVIRSDGARFRSLREASTATNASHSYLSWCIRTNKPCKGYRFKYDQS